ncbi:MAG: heavy metal-responsive transcriptional regulator [Vicinamibacterales bacterium]
MDRTFHIGELAARSGLTADAVRYYERLGLLPPAQRTAGGFRIYAEPALARLRFIRQAQTLGLSLQEIRQLVTHHDENGVKRCRRVRDLLQSKLSVLDARLAEMQHFRGTLTEYLAACEHELARPARRGDRRGGPCCPVIQTLGAKQG